MPTLLKIKEALTNPVWLAYRVCARLDRPALWHRYASLARNAGLQGLYFILSLDCDTVDDISVVWEVHSRLVDMGIKPVYAVPGELLQKGEKIYRRIHESGGEFLNHGYTEHTFFDRAQGAYRSCFFYDTLSRVKARQDIIAGDACVREVLGTRPQGFRTPHFGTFQKPQQLRFLYGVLNELGYRFSTSTMPIYGFRYGPVFRRFGVWEIPVSGQEISPLSIMDSWACFMAPDRTLSPECYSREGEALAKTYYKLGVGLLNYYVDPAHIHDQELFYQTVARWHQVAQPLQYTDLLDKLAESAANAGR